MLSVDKDTNVLDNKKRQWSRRHGQRRNYRQFFFTSKMLVNIHSDFRALFFLTGVDVIGDIGI